MLCVVPSKRAGLFFKNTFKTHNVSCFLPQVQSIENFISTFSGLQKIDSLCLLFEFYKIYLEKHPKNADDFTTFCGWAPTVLSDFNEIDSYLTDTKSFFADLKNVERIKNWGKWDTLKKNTLIETHQNFLSNLGFYYEKLTTQLYDKKLATQGMMYRTCVSKIKEVQNIFRVKKIVFIGFNALNGAEEIIFKRLLEQGIAKIYWDTDVFYKNKQAGVFLRRYKKWNYYQKNAFCFEGQNFEKAKNITEIAAVKNIAQCKAVGNLIKNHHREKKDFSGTAWVLCDESILPLAINSLPKTQGINITVGYPLKNIALSFFFNALFELLKNKEQTEDKQVYSQDISQVLQTKYLAKIFQGAALENFLSDKNCVFMSRKDLQEFLNENPEYQILIEVFFCDSVQEFLEKIQAFLEQTSEQFEKPAAVYLEQFRELMEKLLQLEREYKFLKNFAMLQGVYLQILQNEKLYFQGESTQGLQIVGLLETRCLDFETLWISSLNEGFLPKKANTNSFIPYDVRKAYQLPTDKDKDAIFAYHFYRLIQRAKNIFLLYDCQTDGYGAGEKSRFLNQLRWSSNHKITYKTIISKAAGATQKPIVVPQKNIVKDLKTPSDEIVFSPSGLISYINNPLTYYQRYGLKIHEKKPVAPAMESFEMGAMIHNTLEALYKPHTKKLLKKNDIVQMEKSFENILEKQYRQENINVQEGKNLLIKEVSKNFIKRFLKQEKQRVQKHAIQILHLEKAIKIPIQIEGFDNIFLKGKIDRIEKLDDHLRIIDYKTGKVTQRDLEKAQMESITEDSQYAKAFQLFFLCNALG